MATRILVIIAFMTLLVCATVALRKPRKGSKGGPIKPPKCRDICRTCQQNNREGFPCLYGDQKTCIEDCKIQGTDFKCDPPVVVSTPCMPCECESVGEPLCLAIDCIPSACASFLPEGKCCYEDGANVNDGCNDCTCSGNGWACTKKCCSDCPGEEVNCLVDPCDSATCPGVPGATCMPNYCGGCNAVFCDAKTDQEVDCCDYPCPENYEPVCGSDGKTYSNTCDMGRAACDKMTEITEMSKGECEE